jgi:hypothetical protein
MFLHGLRIYGREWKKMAEKIKTRSSSQIRSHAQKYFAKLAKTKQERAMHAAGARRRFDGRWDPEPLVDPTRRAHPCRPVACCSARCSGPGGGCSDHERRG